MMGQVSCWMFEPILNMIPSFYSSLHDICFQLFQKVWHREKQCKIASTYSFNNMKLNAAHHNTDSDREGFLGTSQIILLPFWFL